MDTDIVQMFIDCIKSERNELRKDLMGLPLNMPGCKVGDFGCGWGHITWCLMLEIPNSRCFGIDKFDPYSPPFPSDIDRMFVQGTLPIFIKANVESLSIRVMEDIKSGVLEHQGDGLLNDIHRMIIDKERFPVFQKGNLVTCENLTLDSGYFDLIYSNRVLFNIFLENNKNLQGNEALNRASTCIANALKPDGWFCLVETKDSHSYMVDKTL